MLKFGLIGAAGYIAPRHMRAIKETGNRLDAAFDPYDGVGIMDSYFPEADYFVEFERFDRHISKLRNQNKALDYISICSPNYLHDSHIRFALRSGCQAICEKPIVLNPWNVDALMDEEKNTNQEIFTILQLRHHSEILKLRDYVSSQPTDKIFEIDLTYLTSRGNWYYTSWKGDETKSGGIATNIGVHFFDMLTWIFGDVLGNDVTLNSHDRASGFLRLEKANVKWFLGINYELVPAEEKKKGLRTFRSIKVDGKEIEFSNGFTDLHTTSYEAIINGKGFRISEAKKAVEIVHSIRNAEIIHDFDPDLLHSLCNHKIQNHPFKRRD